MTLEAEHQNARASGRRREKIAEAVERELAVLREARPHLESRIDRAAGLLVMQLSSGPRTRPMRVRVGSTGKRARFLVGSLTEAGAVYVVDSKGWNCSCPDYHRRGAACKHALASYVLWKADRPRRATCADCREPFHPDRLLEVGEGQATETLNPGQLVCRVCAPKHGLTVPGQRRVGCDACRDNPGWVLVEEAVVDAQTGEVSVAHNPVRCHRCRPPEPGLLTADQMEAWMDESRWIFAKTYAGSGHEHEYALLKHQGPERFHAAARTIWWAGYDRWYLRRAWRTLIVGDFICWVWTRPEGPRQPYPEDTEVINRVPAARARVV